MSTPSLVLIVAACLTHQAAPDTPPLVCHLDRDKLIYATLQTEDGKLPFHASAELHSLEIDKALAAKTDTRFLLSYGCQPAREYYRWRIHEGIFWATRTEGVGSVGARRVPLKELAYYDTRDPRGWEKLDKIGGPARHSWGVSVAGELINSRLAIDSRRELKRNEVVYDVVPTAVDTTLCFLLCEKRMVVWRGKGEWWKENSWWWILEWEKTDAFDVAFQEDVMAFVRSQDYFFVTASGQLVVAKSRPKGGKRQVRKIWDENRPPIKTVLNDARSGKVFLAGPDGTKRFVFEMGENPEPTLYDPAAFADKKLQEPAQGFLSLIRFLDAAKEKTNKHRG